MQDKIIIITGITASGKSELCANLAKRHTDIVIINCDSKQIYREIPIITAQPQEQEALYRLYGYISVKQHYSVSLWLEDLKREINNAQKKLQLPIITGGSGLYISSLINGLSFIPKISVEVRKNVNELSKSLNNKEFYQIVLSKDPKIHGRIAINDLYRLSRALEVITETGQSIFTWQERGRVSTVLKNFKIYTILPNREYVYQRINSRFVTMIKNGAIDEVKNLLSMNLDTHLSAMKACGIQEIIRYLNDEITLNEAICIAQTYTRQYAKRQYTWFKNQFPNSEIIDNMEKVLNLIIY